MVKKSAGKKNNSETMEKSKPMNKKLFLAIPVIVIICIVGFVMFSQNVEATEARAQLANISGTVEVKSTGGSWTTASTGMDLYMLDSIRTGDDSSASIILFESSIIRLDSNTEVTIKEIIEAEETSVIIQQDEGRTWNTISKISGIDNYDVETPTTVASVRGTAFDVNVSSEGITVVSVVKGIVNVEVTEEGTTYTVELQENYSITVDFEQAGQPQVFEPDDWITDNLLEDESFTQDLKQVLYEKIAPYLDEVRAKIDIPDDDIDLLLDLFIQGRFEIPPETPDYIKELFDLS